VISLLALILLTLFGYSAGTILITTGRKAAPALWDLPVLLLLWAAALALRAEYGRGLAILLGIALGLLVGLTLGTLRRAAFQTPRHPAPPPVGLWPRWLAFNQRLGDFQSRLFLAWFYFLLVTPFALILIATSDRLHRKPPESASMWLARAQAANPDLTAARRQF
jgi:hypothetical protein